MQIHFITNFNNTQNNYTNKNCFYNSNMCCASHKMLFLWLNKKCAFNRIACTAYREIEE